MTHQRQKIAILGAGPIGLEAALYATNRGYDVDIYERDTPGAHIRKWSHVQLFSPWELNRSPWGVETLRHQGLELPPDDAYPTGQEFLRKYLVPLAESDALRDRTHLHCEVLQVARRDALKTEQIGAQSRADSPFLLHLDDDGTERYATADVVIDTTGTYRTPNGLGPGGLRARGEERLRDEIEYYIPDVLDDQRDAYADKRTLVVGAGYSAVTTVRNLQKLAQKAPDTETLWLLRDDSPPYPVIEDDPLPLRRRLSDFGNQAVTDSMPGVQTLFGAVHAVDKHDDSTFRVQYQSDDGPDEISAHNLVANVGYRPDLDLFRELQIHTCWATEGPIDLAASLLANDDGSADCLQQDSGGPELLVNPEPDFYLLGSKSYGRNSSFLLQTGHDQIRQLFELRDAKENPR